MINKELFIEKFPYGPLNDTARDTIRTITDVFMEDEGFQYLAELAYILATAYHESAHTFNPGIREIGRGKGRMYGTADGQTGQTYYGRGLVQITWKANYKKFSELLGADFVGNPDLVLEKENSVKIMMMGMKLGLFTGNKLRMYINGNGTDFERARRVVNGMDKSKLIATYARNILKVLEECKIQEA